MIVEIHHPENLFFIFEGIGNSFYVIVIYSAMGNQRVNLVPVS